MTDEPSVEVIAGGPLRVRGVPLVRLVRDGEAWTLSAPVEEGTDGYLVCRCGRSSNLPLCDREPPFGCFTEEPSAGVPVRPFRWEVPGGSVPAVALKAKGPIRLAGGVAVTDEAGVPLDPGLRVSLCRCGASRAQPLCDGSHKARPVPDP